MLHLSNHAATVSAVGLEGVYVLLLPLSGWLLWTAGRTRHGGHIRLVIPFLVLVRVLAFATLLADTQSRSLAGLLLIWTIWLTVETLAVTFFCALPVRSDQDAPFVEGLRARQRDLGKGRKLLSPEEMRQLEKKLDIGRGPGSA